MTNYQKIKEMSVEELADFNIRPIINENKNCDCEENIIFVILEGFETSDGNEFMNYDEAYEHELNWLKQEHKE